MKGVELVRWGVPAAAFLIYFKWGGLALSLLLFLILLAVISGFIHWHRKDPVGFHKGMRVWIVLLLTIPSALLSLGAAVTSPVLLPLALIPLAISIWLLMLNNKAIQSSALAPPRH